MNKKLNNNLKCCTKELEVKQSQLCDATMEQKELESRLFNTSTFIDDSIKNHEMAHAQYTDNYNTLKCKYQNKTKELENANNLKDCLTVKIDEMDEKIRKLSCWLKKQAESNKCLETENCNLKEFDCKDNNYKYKLENEIQNRIKCSENIVEELNVAALKMEEKNQEVKKEKEECRRLKCKIERVQNEILKKVEHSKVLEMQLTKDKDMLKTEIQIQKNRNMELNKILCEQKTERQELSAALEKSYEKIDALKRTLDKVRVQTQQYIDYLRKERSNHGGKEREELDRETERQMEELKKLENENKRLRCQMDELQCKFETIIKNSEEKQKLSTEKIEKINCDTKKLMLEMTSKNQTIKDLEEKLSKVERTHKTEIENMHCFKRELENLKQKQTTMPSKYKPSSCTDKCQELVSRKMCMDFDGFHTSSRNVHGGQDLEDVLTKCNSIINYCKK